MDAFRIWLIGLMAVSILLTVLSTLLPEGTMKKIAGVTGGLVLLLTLLRGIKRLDLADIRLSYENCSLQISSQMKIYEAESRQNMESLIQERCSAYISEQAEALGLVCNPLVETMWTEENIPLPVAVAMDIPFHEELSRILAENLGIDATNQKWLTSEG